MTPSTVLKRSDSWWRTPSGDKRGFIQPHQLSELWFHTGTACNLACPFCLEGSKPNDTRLGKVNFEDVKPFLDEALDWEVKQFSFTGGEPFIVKDIVKILDYALNLKPCLVLTNGTKPLLKRLDQLAPLLGKANSISFRISLDHHTAEIHDHGRPGMGGRGAGTFEQSLECMEKLHQRGFKVSVARQQARDENTPLVEKAYRDLFHAHGLPADLHMVAFPEFHGPGAEVSDVPHITEGCMTRFHDAASRRQFMCAFSKMVIKKDGQMRVYACTLTDDDAEYDLGGSLRESMSERVSMKHHRCYSCFAFGASCSEM